MGTFGKSACFRTTKNGTSGGKIKILIVQTFPKYCRKGFYFKKVSLLARFWPNFNFVDFRAYFGHFSLVESAKNKIAFLQQKECSNKKIEENKSCLEFNSYGNPSVQVLILKFGSSGPISMSPNVQGLSPRL